MFFEYFPYLIIPTVDVYLNHEVHLCRGWPIPSRPKEVGMTSIISAQPRRTNGRHHPSPIRRHWRMTSLHNSPTKRDWDIGKTRRLGTSRPSWLCISRPNKAMDGKWNCFVEVQRSNALSY